MKVKFLVDYFDAGQKIFEAGKEYEGELAHFVRRGNAVEVKDPVKPAEPPKDEKKGEKK